MSRDTIVAETRRSDLKIFVAENMDDYFQYMLGPIAVTQNGYAESDRGAYAETTCTSNQ